jgi:hypothetical protein
MRLSPTWMLVGLVTVHACGSSGSGPGVSTATFSPNPSVVSAGLCASDLTVQEISGNALSLVSMDAVFTDEAGKRADYSYDAAGLASAFGSVSIPAKGALTGSFSFDLGSTGLSFPATGTVVLIGAGPVGTVTHFVGELSCNRS